MSSWKVPGRRRERAGRFAVAGLLAAVSLSASGRASAQAPVATPEMVTVRGIAFDSLARRPLAGAGVWTADGRRATVSDARGRFTLDSVAVADGAVVILAEHVEAREAGIATLVGRAVVEGNGPVAVTLAVPSYATIRSAACASARDAGHEEGGILVGTVRDASSGNLVAGAAVRISWIRFRGRSALTGGEAPAVIEEAVDLATDGVGSFQACGLPTSSDVRIQALAALAGVAGGPATSGELPVRIGERRVLRRDLLVGSLAGGVMAARVQAADGRPLAGARVYVGDDDPVDVGRDGQALIRDVPLGTRTVSARSIGFAPEVRTVDVVATDTARVEFTLAQIPQMLQAARVEGVRMMEELELRRRAGGGHVVTGEQLAGNAMLVSVFQQLPSLSVQGTGARFNVMARDRFAGWCTMSVYVDGQKSDMDGLQLFAPNDLMAVEVYPRGIAAPQRYLLPRDIGGCGVILAWTRR